MRVPGNRCATRTHQEIQIGSFVRLQHMVTVEFGPSSFRSLRRKPFPSASRQLSIVDFHLNEFLRSTESNRVPGTYHGQRSTYGRFRRHVKNDSSVRRAAHARMTSWASWAEQFAGMFPKLGAMRDELEPRSG
jgi:hypothetical protein